MSEEQVAEAQEAPVEQAVSEAVIAEESPDGTDFIDFESLDPKVKARFDRIYRNMKDNERALIESARTQRQLVERLTKLEKSDINSKSANAIANLNRQKAQALEEGDAALVVELDNKIRAVEQSQNYQPAPIDVPEPASGGLSPQEEAQMESWAAEKSETGELKRPWADPGHPLHQKAASLGYAVMQDPTKYTLEEQLAEIDRLMGVETGSPKRVSPGVLPTGEGGRRPGKKQVGLTPDQKAIARVMYPEAKSASEAEERYAAAMKNVGA